MDSSQKARVNPTLLLADDSVTIQKVIELTFADQGVRVIAVGDGDSAIALVEQAPPDIVLADVGMPGKSGYEVSRYIKRTPRLAHIPVLLLTGAFDPLDQSRAREAGCDGVLEKPFEPQAVISRVRELLGLRTADSTPAEPAAPAPPTMPEPERASPPAGNAGAPPAPATNGDYFERLGAALANSPTGPADNIARDVLRPQSYPATDNETGSAAKEGPSTTAPAASPVMAQTPPPPNASLADAFAALLAAEQRGVGSSEATAPWLPAAPTATDDLVEQVAQRVLDRLSKQVVRETVAEAVSEIAERLVVEEIERIKAAVK